MTPLENRLYELYLRLGNEAHIFGNEEGCDVDALHECIDELEGIQDHLSEVLVSHSEALSSLQAKHDRYEEALKRIRMMTGQGSPYNRIATEALADEVTDERAQNGNDHG